MIKIQAQAFSPESTLGIHFIKGLEKIDEIDCPFWELTLGIGIAFIKFTRYTV